jgi:putative chitinase
MITKRQFRDCVPGITEENVNKYYDPLTSAMERFKINTPLRMSAFIAQVAHESGHFRLVSENLNYRAETLLKVFPKYYKTMAEARAHAGKPERIANRVYGGRMGNGSESSGDGFRYRGRGLIQLTGRFNYDACGKGLGIDFIRSPELLETPGGASLSAAWYWNSRNINVPADARDFVRVTRLINGGTIGLEDRTKLYNIARRVLGA